LADNLIAFYRTRIRYSRRKHTVAPCQPVERVVTLIVQRKTRLAGLGG